MTLLRRYELFDLIKISLSHYFVDYSGHAADMMYRPTPSIRFSFNYHFASLVWNKALFNVKGQTSKTHLSYLWWVLEPILYMAVLYVVFGLVLERGGPEFVPYLLTGLVPFQWLSKSITESSDSILRGKDLMLKIRISPLFFPLSELVSSSLKEVPVFMLLVIYLLVTGYTAGMNWFALPLVLFLQILLTVGFCFLLSLAIPYLRDLLRLVPMGIQSILFGSGVFYRPEQIPPDWIDLFFLNPIACLFHMYRQILLYGEWPNLALAGYVLIFGLTLLFLTIPAYRSLSSSYAKVTNQ